MDTSADLANNPHLPDIIIDHVPVGICSIKADGVVDFTNRAFRSMLGLTSGSSMVGGNILEFPLYQQIGLTGYIQSALGGKAFEMEVHITINDHFTTSYMVKGVPVYTQGSAIDHVLLLAHDATDRKRMELDMQDYVSKLRTEQQRFLASVNSLTSGFIIIDVKNNVLIKNQAIDRMLDLTDMEGSILLMGDISYIEDKFKGTPLNFHDSWNQVLRDKKQFTLKEMPYRDKVLHVFMAPVEVTSKETIGVVVMIEDITEAKVLERSKDEFFSIASHELRTPLTAIRGNTSMIKQFYAEKLNDPDFSQMITDIHDASIRLIQIVNDFLDLSRLQQGRFVFKMQSCNIVDVVSRVLKDLDSLAKEKKLNLPVEGTGEPVMALADPDRVQQVLTNLVGNALKFTEAGEVKVRVEKSDGLVKIRVSDTGRGIPEDGKALLFRKFQQAGNSLLTRDTVKGTGLGLYISKLLVEGMGGEIGLEGSEAGKGSTFFFTLKEMKVDEPVSPPA